VKKIGMTETELKKRTKQSGLRIIKLVDALPNTHPGRTFASLLIRTGTSVGANYRAACRRRSKSDLISKLDVVEKEAGESAFWLELIIDGQLLKEKLVPPLLTEAEELTKIMTLSRITAPQRERKRAWSQKNQ